MWHATVRKNTAAEDKARVAASCPLYLLERQSPQRFHYQTCCIEEAGRLSWRARSSIIIFPGRNVLISSSGLRVSELTHREYKGGTVFEIHRSCSATEQMTCFLSSETVGTSNSFYYFLCLIRCVRLTHDWVVIKGWTATSLYNVDINLREYITILIVRISMETGILISIE